MADSSFYQRHYGGLLKLGQTELQAFSQQMLSPGKRYHLLIKDLQANNPGGKPWQSSDAEAPKRY